MAAAVAVSVAVTGLAKLLLLLAGTGLLIRTMTRRQKQSLARDPYTTYAVILMIGALALSVTYSSAPLPEAIGDMGKYAKLLVIVMVPLLLRTRRAALTALVVFAAAQSFVLLSSYLLSLGLSLPWVFGVDRTSVGTVFSGQLDQAIMTAGFSALCWHLRREFPGRYGPALAIGLAVAGAVNVLFLMPGRTGQVALIAAMSFALFTALQGRARVVVLLLPLVMVAFAMFVSPMFRDRVVAVATESQAYREGDRSPTSSGLRLNYWYRTAQAIGQSPLIGYGAGSWPYEFTRLDGKPATARNPHQEFLMWGIQLGLAGIALLALFFVAVIRDCRRFPEPVRTATQSFVVVLFVACLFNSILFDALIGDYFCVVLGILLTLGLTSTNYSGLRAETNQVLDGAHTPSART